MSKINIFLKLLSRLTLFLLICISPLSDSSQIQSKVLNGLFKDIPIGEIDHVKLSINIAFPQQLSQQPRPVLLMIHGGGFLKGNKGMNDSRIRKMAELGFVAASAMYRLAPEHKFPAALDDVKLAIRFLKAHATEYHINPKRIIISGASSGSYLAVMAGVTGNSNEFSDHGYYVDFDSSVHAVAGQSSPIADFRLAKYADFSLIKRLLETNSKHTLATMSPITYLDPSGPPMFLSHGDSDPIVPVDMSREFVQELQRIGHNHEYHEIKGGTHSFSQSAPKKAKDVFEAYLNFLDRWTQ